MPLKWSLPQEEEAQTALPAPIAAAGFIAGFLCAIAPLPQLIVDKSSSLSLLAGAYIPSLCAVGVMSFLLFRFGGREVFQIRRPTAEDLKFCFTGTFGIIIVYMIVNALWKNLLIVTGIEFEENQQLMIFAQNISGIEFFLFAVLVTILVPVAEELLFRRILYGGLVGYGQDFALIATSLFFAAVHLFLAGFAGLLVIGIGFQLLYLYKKNLLISILSHSLLNACAVAFAALAKGAPSV